MSLTYLTIAALAFLGANLVKLGEMIFPWLNFP